MRKHYFDDDRIFVTLEHTNDFNYKDLYFYSFTPHLYAAFTFPSSAFSVLKRVSRHYWVHGSLFGIFFEEMPRVEKNSHFVIEHVFLSQAKKKKKLESQQVNSQSESNNLKSRTQASHQWTA